MLSGQTSSKTVFDTPRQVIQPIPKGAADIEVDQEGNVYLLSPEKHKLHKLFQNTAYDSVLTIGGKGIGKEGFDYPTKISVPNRQQIYLLDYLNRRLVLLNTNLKVMKDVSFLTLELNVPDIATDVLWPISFAVGPTGELYLLNQEDFRIYKLNSSGVLERAFAGMDYGSGSVKDPWDLSMNSQNLIFAADSTEQETMIYDLFGTFQYRLSIPMKFRWKTVVPHDKNLFFIGEQNVFVYNLFSKNGTEIKIKGSGRLLDAAVSRDFIFLLFEDRVAMYRI